MPLLILENNFSYTQSRSQWLCSVLHWKSKNTVMMVKITVQFSYKNTIILPTYLLPSYFLNTAGIIQISGFFAPANEKKKKNKN